MGGPDPRVMPLPPELWDERVSEALNRAGMGEVPPASVGNAVMTLLRHPRLAGSFLRFNMGLLVKPALKPRWRELMILRVAWRAGCPYEWLQHVVAAELNEVTRAEVEAVAAGAAAGWTPLEAALLAATDQLLDDYRIHDGTWERLSGHLDGRQLIEVPFVVGTYTCLAMAFNSLGIQPDEGLEDEGAWAPDCPAQGG